jgi:hypothetical protein
MNLQSETFTGDTEQVELTSAQVHPSPNAEVKSSYMPPRLTVYGDLRDLTLGTTLGPADSGGPTPSPNGLPV